MIFVMKRIITLCAALIGILSVLTFMPAPVLGARAEETLYAVAESADVWFLETESEDSKLFCIPRTYYVKVLSKGEKFSLCEYLRDSAPYRKVRGYCLTDSLKFVDFVPVRPFLFREVTVEYVLPGAARGAGTVSG